jgi:hypothetical protein
VTLHDGREVDSSSENWRAECEARYVLRLKSKQQRHAYLDSVAKRRGSAARDSLESLVMAVWKAGRMTGQDTY